MKKFDLIKKICCTQFRYCFLLVCFTTPSQALNPDDSKNLELCKRATTIWGDWLPTSSGIGEYKDVTHLKQKRFIDIQGGQAQKHVAAAKAAGLTTTECRRLKVLSNSKPKSASERLKNLKNLLDSGLIEKADYDKKKGDILKDL